VTSLFFFFSRSALRAFLLFAAQAGQSFFLNVVFFTLLTFCCEFDHAVCGPRRASTLVSFLNFLGTLVFFRTLSSHQAASVLSLVSNPFSPARFFRPLDATKGIIHSFKISHVRRFVSLLRFSFSFGVSRPGRNSLPPPSERGLYPSPPGRSVFPLR